MASGTPSELAASEMPVSDVGVEGGAEVIAEPMATFPPYPPYVTEPAPPSVADTIIAGRDLRLKFKSKPKRPVRPPPKPAKPRSPKATDVKMTRRAYRAHARCLRKHGAVLTDRLERISKPRRRNIIYMWREHANALPPETIARLRAMLDADEPFKPDQAYEYFVNLKKTRKRNAANARVNEIKKDMLAMCGEKRFVWARNATVAFARGIQQRLSRSGRYALADGMLRLSNIILDDICGYMHMRTPSRRSTHPKAKFMMEMSDKVAVWIDEILSESDDRMLMMDFDEDEEVERFYNDLLKPEEEEPLPKDAPPVRLSGESSGELELNGNGTPVTPHSDDAKPHSGDATPHSGDATPHSGDATPHSGDATPHSGDATPHSGDATPHSGETPAVTPAVTPGETPASTPGATPKPSDVINPFRRADAGGDFEDEFLGDGSGVLLSQPDNAHLKFTGNMKEAFELLTDSMDNKGDEKLLSLGKFEQTYHEGADELRAAPDLGATQYSTTVADEIKNKLETLTKDITPKNIDPAMKDIVDISSKFLAQNAEFNKKKGPALKLLTQQLRNNPNNKLIQKDKIQKTNAEAANDLEHARGLDSNHDDPILSKDINEKMSKLVEGVTPKDMKKEMAETLDTATKYLSQKAVDDNERGPAFELLIKQLQKRGGESFSDYPALSTKNAAAYTLSSAPGLTSVSPDPATAPEFKKALHKAIDSATPPAMRAEMKDVVNRCADYLSGFIRDRGPAMDALLGMMKSKPNNVIAKRNNYTMDYGTAAQEIENAPTLVPFLPVKDIADEMKQHLTKDMKKVTPPELKVPMQTLIDDASKSLSQSVAMRSGAAGERYPMNFLAAVKDSLGAKPLYKTGEYGQTYADAAEELKHAGPILDSAIALASQMGFSKLDLETEEDPKFTEEDKQAREDLRQEIATQINKSIPSRLAPSVVEGLQSTINKAAKHLAKIGSAKGKALHYLLDLMEKKKGAPLGKLQGYEQTMDDGRRRIKNAPTLTNKKVDKNTYEAVKGKLNALAAEDTGAEKMKLLPEMIDESAKYLSAPIPKTEAEKRSVLADLMGRKEDEVLGEDGIYKMSYSEGGKEIEKALVGVTKAHDEEKKKEMLKKIEDVMPNKRMGELLKEPIKEGAAHLTDVVKGRGEAMEVIHDSLKKENGKEFLNVGDFSATHEKAANMLANAPFFETDKASPVIMENVEHKVASLPKYIPPDKIMAKEHMEDTEKIAANYIAAEATKKSGLTPAELKELDEAGFNAEAKAAAEKRRLDAIEAGVSTKYGAKGEVGADGKPTGGVGPDGKPTGGVGPDGKPIAVVGPDGKPIAGVGPDGKPIAGMGPDGKPVAVVGPDGKPIAVVGPDGKPVAVMGPDGKPVAVVGPDGKPVAVVGPDGKPIAVVGPDGKPIAVMGPDGKPIAVMGPDGKPIGGVGPDGKPIGGVGPDGKPIAGMGPDGKPIAVMGPDGKPIAVMGPDGKPIAVMGPDGKPIAGVGPDGKPIVVVGPDGKPIAGVGPDGKPITVVGPDGKSIAVVGPDGKPIAVMGPDGKPIAGVGPDGKPIAVVGPDGKPIAVMGPDGKPIAVMGPDGKPITGVGPDGKPIAFVGPDGKPIAVVGPDGKPIAVMGPDGKPITGVGPDGKPIAVMGPDGKPIAFVGPDGKPIAVVGPDGKPIAVMGPDGKPITGVGPDGKPIAVMGPDGKPIAFVGPDGKPIAVVGPDGKPIAVMGPDGKPITGVGPDGKPIAVMGPDGKPIAFVGPDGKPIAVVGPDGKPIAVVGPDGKLIAVMGPDGKPIAGIGPDGKPIAGVGPDGKPIAVVGPDGKPIAGIGPDGKPIAGVGPDGKPIAVVGPDGKPIGGVGPDGKQIAVVGPDGKPISVVGPDGKQIAVVGPDGKPISVVGPDGKPIAVMGPDGKPIAVMGPDGKPVAVVGPDGKPVAVVGPDGKPIAVMGPDGKPIAVVGPDGKPIAVVGPDGKPIAVMGPDGKPVAVVGPDGKPVAVVGPDGKPIAVMGPDGKPIAVVGPDGKPIAVVGPDGKPIAVMGPDGKPVAVVGPDGKPVAVVGPDGKPIAVVGPDGKPVAVMGPDGKPIAVVGPDGMPLERIGPDGKPVGGVGPDGKPIEGVGPDGKPIAGVGADGKAEAGAGSSKRSGAGGASGTRDARYGPGGAEKGPGGAGYRQGGTGYGPGGTGYGPGGTGYGPGFETEEQRRRRLAEAEEYRKYEEGERRRLGDKEYFRRLAEKSAGTGTGKYHGGALGADYDPEHEAALDILHRELRARGAEMFYEQPQTSLTHEQASDWLLMLYPMRVDKCVRDSADTARLYKKFEKKLGNLVNQVTPPDLYDSMQDVVIEGAQRLSEFFVATNFKAQVHEALISEMQKHGNEILTEVDGAAETYFFAAQRLKKTKSIYIHEPCYRIAEHLTKKLEDMIHTRSMPRKLMAAMKDHVKSAADYLSALVTKPDDQIEAYVALLGEMETAGDKQLIEGDIPKSYKEAAAYLRQLTSFEDKIGLPNSALQSAIQSKLRNLMSNVRPSGYSPHVMETVIVDTTGLLVSYIMLQGKKTEVLKALIREMDQAGDGVLLRHGPIRKSFKEGADLLRELNTDQLKVLRADNVASRKIQIKLNNLMIDKTPEHFQALMDDVIEETTMFLAVHLLQPQVVQVCKCMKNVFVQCELWCDEILRRVARPCCMCLRHVSTQALHDLPPALHVTPGSTQMFAPGIDISFKTCPTKHNRLSTHSEPLRVCPHSNPTSGCLRNTTTSYLLYSTTYKNFGHNSKSLGETPSSSSSTHNNSAVSSAPSRATLSKCSSPLKSALFQAQEMQSLEREIHEAVGDTSRSYFTPLSKVTSGTTEGTGDTYPILDGQYSNFQVSSDMTSKITQAKSGYSSPTPIISTGKMEDWHVMMVSLMWNTQAWRDWIQEIVDRALAYQPKPNIKKEETADSWTSFHRSVLTEALQWRQYSIFSHQLTTQLVQRYNNKEIVSPMGAVRKTKTYLECQEEMLTIIDIFNRWTQWLTLVIKETESLLPAAGSDVPLQEMRWSHLKKKVMEYSKDWANYIMYLKVSWEQKYVELIAEFLPFSKDPGPVWVVSACGAVPSGAVAAGVYDGEVIWVARTTHRCTVLPAALFPSKHCCLVYAEGAVHRYSKYQVMCNAEVRWVAWRRGSIAGRAVRVAAGVHVGRVQYHGGHLLGAVHEPYYRCHVVIYGRPFAFNCYELLMLADGDE